MVPMPMYRLPSCTLPRGPCFSATSGAEPPVRQEQLLVAKTEARRPLLSEPSYRQIARLRPTRERVRAGPFGRRVCASTGRRRQRPSEVRDAGSCGRHERVDSLLAQPADRVGLGEGVGWGGWPPPGGGGGGVSWGGLAGAGAPPPVVTDGGFSSGCSTASSSASLRRIARASASSASAGSRSGCGGAYPRRSCSAGPWSAIRWMVVWCLARERAVYAHSWVNSSGRPTAIAFSTVAPWLEWPVIAYAYSTWLAR